MRNCENCIHYRQNKPYTRGGKNGGQFIQLVSCTVRRRYIAKQYNELRALKCGDYKDKET